MSFVEHSFICRLSDFTVLEDGGFELTVQLVKTGVSTLLPDPARTQVSTLELDPFWPVWTCLRQCCQLAELSASWAEKFGHWGKKSVFWWFHSFEGICALEINYLCLCQWKKVLYFYLPRVCPAAPPFIFPLSSYAAEQSASWQHWSLPWEGCAAKTQ